MPSYAAFFDAGGPAWANTRIVPFADVAAGLARVCREFGLGVDVDLPRRNCGDPSGGCHPASGLKADLTAAVRRRFAWYHATYGDGGSGMSG